MSHYTKILIMAKESLDGETPTQVDVENIGDSRLVGIMISGPNGSVMFPDLFYSRDQAITAAAFMSFATAVAGDLLRKVSFRPESKFSAGCP